VIEACGPLFEGPLGGSAIVMHELEPESPTAGHTAGLPSAPFEVGASTLTLHVERPVARPRVRDRARRSALRRSWLVLTVAAIVVLAGFGIAAYAWTVVPAQSGVSTAATHSGAGTICSLSRLPSALDILHTNPNEPFPAGAVIKAGYDFKVVNYTTYHIGQTVKIPVVQALFPTTGGSDLEVTIPAHSKTISSAAYSSEVSANSTKLTTALTFSASSEAQFETEGYYAGSPVSDAVQATAPYGNLTLEFRWTWTLTEPNRTSYVAPWTVPTFASSPPQLPSIFYPAQEVTSKSDTESAAMGAYFIDNLTGYVANTTFTLSFQSTNGTVLGTYFLRTPVTGGGPFAAAILLVSPSHVLSAGWYIFHAQDRCGALVQDVWFQVTYPHSATIQIGIAPPACGSTVTVNGTAYANDSTAVIKPSATTVSLSAALCPGYAFAGWQSTGGVLPGSPTLSSTTLLVSWAGTLSATWGGSGAVTFTESNLTVGDVWNITLGGVTQSANASRSISFTEAPGTFSYVVGSDEPGLATPSQGTVTFAGSPVAVSVTFSAESIQHVVVIMMENSELDTILSYAPYMDYLWNTYGHASAFYPVCHPSLSDYTAITSGRTYNCGGSINESAAPDLPDLLQSAGLPWGGYFESMPSACDRSWDGTAYDPSHNPFLVSEDIVNNASRCDADVVNSVEFNRSVANGTLPAFSMYVPNTQDDCEYSDLPVCNAWLQAFLPSMINSTVSAVRNLMNHTAFFIVFDEGLTYNGYSVGGIENSYCLNSTGLDLTTCGGHTYLTVVSPYSLGSVYDLNSTGFNLATTIEWLLGVGSTGGYDGNPNFPAMESLFWPT
jgi:Phosphoesterase family